MHMMPLMKIFPVLPLIPALFVFGMGMVLLHYAKKESSCSLKWGGWVMTVGTTLIMLFLLVIVVKQQFRCGENQQGPQCPMMQGMEGSQGGGHQMMQGMHPGPNPMPPQQQPAPAPHKMMHRK